MIVLVSNSVLDSDVGITLDKTRPDIGSVTLTATINITICLTGVRSCFIANLTTANDDVGIAADLRQLATTIDTLRYGTATHCNGGIAGDQS